MEQKTRQNDTAIRFLLLFLHFVIFSTVMKTESTTYNLLDSISYPEDLRKLSVEQLPEVCEELRQDIIQELRATRDTLQQVWVQWNLPSRCITSTIPLTTV